MFARSLFVAFAFVTTSGPLVAQTSPQAPVAVTTSWLADHIKDPHVIVVEVTHGSEASADHIPGARPLDYMSLVQDVNGIASELPAADSIRALLEGLGASDDSHIVLTGGPLMVTRAFFTFDYFGFPRVSALDGGVTKWKSEGRPTQRAFDKATRGRVSPRAPLVSAVASTEWVKSHVGKRGISFFDTRTEGEYLGTDHSDGHIDGARRIEWKEYFPDANEFRLADRQALLRLWGERIDSPRDTVVAYCAVGYRASGTYFVSRLLGIPVKLYDGSYDAWSKAKLPVTKTPTPLLTRSAPEKSGGGLPAVSPDGQFVAYNALRDGKQADTYVIRADGTGERRLTDTPQWEAAPQWLGRNVVTGVVVQDTSRLFTASPDEPTVTPLARVPGREARVSPDGKRLLYVFGSWPKSQLVVANLDGAGARAITDEDHAAFNPAWSPDGRRVAYTVADMSTHAIQVAVVDADGKNQRQLTHFADEDGGPQWAAWSPDGKRIAIQSGKYSREKPETNTSYIWIISLADNSLKKLNAHDRPYLDETPSWFPDGKRIAFQSDRSGVMQIWLMNDDGTGARQLTSWKPNP
jgi:thiosulfate/3-mercaptopyruvate sulfurtransferase